MGGPGFRPGDCDSPNFNALTNRFFLRPDSLTARA